jgi:hypothetical protein
MPAPLAFVLRRYPALESFEHTTRAISSFLGPPPNLLLSQACKRGSIAMLDWIWTTSCATAEARTPGWSLTNYLRSDPHYYRWQFAQSLHEAAERGDLEIAEWLFAHFSGCEAPAEVVDTAVDQGNLRVLRFLWGHRSCKQNAAVPTERLPMGDEGVASACTVEFRERHDFDGDYWGDLVIAKAVENGQLAQCLDDGMQLVRYDRATAIEEALRLGDVELAARVVPPGRSILHYAAKCPQPEVLARLLSEGFLRWNEARAAVAFGNLAKGGSCELMRQLLQLHSPLREDHSHWKSIWWEALEAACSGGNLPVLQWLTKHPLGGELCNLAKQRAPDRG